VRGAFDAGHTGIVLNECVGQTGESRVMRNDSLLQNAEGELALPLSWVSMLFIVSEGVVRYESERRACIVSEQFCVNVCVVID